MTVSEKKSKYLDKLKKLDILKQTVICSHCGAENSGNGNFCSECGKKMHQDNSSEPVDSPAGSSQVQNGISGRQLTFIGLALAILWFITINPAQGNIFNVTYLDLATMDCGDSDDNDESSGFEMFDDLEEDLDNWCKDTKRDASFLVLGGFAASIFLFWKARNPPDPELSLKRQEEAEEKRVKAREEADEKRRDLKRQDKLDIKRIRADKVEIEKRLSLSRSEWDAGEDEWQSMQQEISKRRKSFSVLAFTIISSGTIVSGLILIASGLSLNIPEEELRTYISLPILVSLSIPLIIWIKMTSKPPILPNDHHLAILKGDILSMENELSKLDSRLSRLKRRVDDGA